jgi:small subunit ribosomal protein S21
VSAAAPEAGQTLPMKERGTSPTRLDTPPQWGVHCEFPNRRFAPVSPVSESFAPRRGGAGSFAWLRTEGGKVVKLLVRDRESIQEAVRRFRKLVERSGIKKEMRRREHYEKPSEIKRRARLRAERRSRRTREMPVR